MLNELEKKIISLLQDNIPIAERPYYELSKKINITEQCFIDTLKALTHNGIMRRFGATIKHQKSGYNSNAMTAWKVRISQINKVGSKIASFKEVSHCYQRNPVKKWPYNLYAMIHGKNKKECCKTIEKISQETQVYIYSILYSVKELKKKSMIYFSNK